MNRTGTVVHDGSIEPGVRTAATPRGSRPIPGFEPVDVSIIVPFWNEAGNLQRLADELAMALQSQPRRWEAVLVDDGSTDASPAEARAVQAMDRHFRLVQLRRHLGKSAALAAGRDASTGSILVTIDADLQDAPAAIPAFLDRIDAGYDVVAARRDRRQESWWRRLVSAAFNRLMQIGTRVPISDMNAGLKAYRREVLASIHLSRGMHRFLAVYAHGRGFRLAEVPVVHRQRHHGRTKYGGWRYVETIVCMLMVGLLRRGPDHAMRLLVRLAAVLAPLGLAAAAIGWAAGHVGAIVGGFLLLVVAAQLLVSRLVGEILFHLTCAAGSAPRPYELAEAPASPGEQSA